MSLQCFICEKNDFASKHALFKHIKTHGKLHQCPYVFEKKRCTKKHPSHLEIVTHLLSRHGQRGYLCEQCNDVFTSTKTRAEHIKRIHEDKSKLKEHAAKPCGRTFYYKSSKLKHEKAHKDGTNLKCKKCEKCFIKIRELSKHINKAHEKPAEVPNVEKEFNPDVYIDSPKVYRFQTGPSWSTTQNIFP